MDVLTMEVLHFDFGEIGIQIARQLIIISNLVGRCEGQYTSMLVSIAKKQINTW